MSNQTPEPNLMDNQSVRISRLMEMFTLVCEMGDDKSLAEAEEKFREFSLDIAREKYCDILVEQGDEIPSENEIDQSNDFDEEIADMGTEEEVEGNEDKDDKGMEDNPFAEDDEESEEEDVEEKVDDLEQRLADLEQEFQALVGGDDEEGMEGEDDLEPDTNLDGEEDEEEDVDNFSFNGMDDEDEDNIREATKLTDMVKDPQPGQDDSSNNKSPLTRAPKPTNVSPPPRKGNASPVRAKDGGDGKKGDNKPKDNTPSSNIDVKTTKVNTAQAMKKGDR